VGLQNFLRQTLDGTVSRQDFHALVHYACSIGELYLNQRWRSLGYLYALNGLTAGDLAMDCVGDLFARSQGRNFFRLEKFALSLHQPLEHISDHEMYFAFKSFVVVLVKARLAKLFAEADPEGAKIHRNLRDGLKKIAALELHQSVRGYVIQPRSANLLEDCREFPLDELENQLLAVLPRSVNIVTFLQHVAAVLSKQKTYRRSVPLFDLVQVFKSLRVHLEEVNGDDVAHLQIDSDAEIDLEMVENTIRTVQKKIIYRFVLEKKITPDEADHLSDTLRDVIAAWREGIGSKGHNGISLFKHTQRHFGCTESEYEQRWRVKVEYLTKIAREHLLLYLEGDL
jgi:hypothetical protein